MRYLVATKSRAVTQRKLRGLRLLRRWSFRGVPGYNLPFAIAPNVNFCEPPIVTHLFVPETALADERACDNRSVSNCSHGETRGFVLLELHLAGAPDGKGLGFVEEGHLWNGNDKFIGPNGIERGCVASQVGFVPSGFKAFEFALVCGGLCLCLGREQGKWRSQKGKCKSCEV
jgi:hypothetical protein